MSAVSSLTEEPISYRQLLVKLIVWDEDNNAEDEDEDDDG